MGALLISFSTTRTCHSGITISEEYGGINSGYLQHTLVMEGLSLLLLPFPSRQLLYTFTLFRDLPGVWVCSSLLWCPLQPVPESNPPTLHSCPEAKVPPGPRRWS